MKLIVREVAEREGIRNANELSVKTGIPLFSMYRIWDGRAKMIALETMDRLCTVLKVKPGQLFEHEAEPDLLPQPGAPESQASKPRRDPQTVKQKRTRQTRTQAAVATG